MKVFISYTHNDTLYKDELVTELSHLNRLGGIDLWHDGLITAGHPWQAEIEHQLADADAAFLLISNAFLGSSFCQNEEVSRLLMRRAREGLVIYPIVVHSSNWDLYPWLREMQLCPLDQKGRVRALSDMRPPSRKKFYASICDELYNLLTQRASHASGKGQQLDSAEERVHFARRLASSYPRRQKETLKELVTSYKWLYERGLTRPALHLANAFSTALSEQSHEIADEDHRDVLCLLRAGFPIDPVHLKDLSSLDVESLISTSGYPALMLGIRLTENDHSAALKLLATTGRQHHNLSSCALLAYALGQCHRKLHHLYHARGMLNLALDRLNTWKQEFCECGPRCPKDGLLVEIHRGIGTILRKSEDFGQAQQHFELARRHLTEKVSDVIRSDFFYSYGYFIYERAVLERKGLEGRQFRVQLAAAQECFENSSHLRPQWGAPLSRLQICRQLLGEANLPDLWKARQCCLFEQGVEANVTAIVCGFAILLTHDMATGKDTSRGLTSHELYQEAEELFENRLIPKGARNCHAFDIEATRDMRPIDHDRWLSLVHHLLRESSEWNYLTLTEQREHLEDFRRKHGIKKTF